MPPAQPSALEGLERALALGCRHGDTGPLGDQLEGLAVIIGRRGAGAGMRPGSAVVLSLQRDAVALLLGILREGGSRRKE